MASQQLRQDWDKPRFIVFVTGGVLTVLVSIWLFTATLITATEPIHPLVFVIVLGTPFAYWLAWITSSCRIARVFAVLIFMAAMAPAIAGLAFVLYLPGLLGLLIGTPDLERVPETTS